MNYVEFGHHGLLLLGMYHVKVTVRRASPCLEREKEKERMGKDVWTPSTTRVSIVQVLEFDEGHPQEPPRRMLADLRRMLNLWNLKKEFNLVVLNKALDHRRLPHPGQMPPRCLEV